MIRVTVLPRLFPLTLLLVLVFAGLIQGRSHTAAAAPVVIYAVTASNPPRLITFSSATPGTIASSVAITGMLTQNVGGNDFTETLLGIDIRPATGVLYGVGAIGPLGSSRHV